MIRVRSAAVLFTLAIAGSVFGATYVVPRDAVLVGKSDAIVIARPIASRVEYTKQHGVETVTVFALEATLKGTISTGFSVRVPGGAIIEKNSPPRFKAIPGAPRFSDGEQVLLFLNRFERDSYSVTDFALGLFGFATDDVGHRVLIRAESEIHGWNPDGTIHHESRREADAFTQYIRDVAEGRPVAETYMIESRPLMGESPSIQATSKMKVALTACNGCSVTQYTLTSGNEASAGFRWMSFPVSWNRGSAAPANAPNGGSDAINAAFTAWQSNSSVNYVLSTTIADSDGIEEDADGRNNIVYEKPLTGIGPFQCLGGVLGLGGVSFATTNDLNGGGDTRNNVNGELFLVTTEGDVSMNVGVSQCIGTNPGIPVGDFNSAVTHEVGHTLGLRHADQNRDNSMPCTNFAAYDCATSAIMTATVTNGLNATLSSWDQRAISALYPVATAAAPTGVVATAVSTTSVTVSWSAVPGATTYQVHRSLSNNASSFAVACTATAPTTTCTDTMATPTSAYLYKVRVGTTGTFSTTDLATTVTFTDTSLSGVAIKAVHFNELRTAVNAIQTLAGQTVTPYTDPTLSSAISVKAAHVTELRTRLSAARSALLQTGLTFTDPSLTSVLVKGVHVTELRAGTQ